MAYTGSAYVPTISREYGGFWIRFVAAIIDGILLAIVQFIIGLVIDDQTTTTLINIVLGWLYFAGMESSANQATLGKRVMGLQVTDLEGDRIGFGKATGRYFAKIISALILFIGYFMIGFTEKKQGLHDMIAGTLVIKNR